MLGTLVGASRLPLRKWVVGIYLMTIRLKGVISMKLRCDLGITLESAWFMAQRIREGWFGGQPQSGESEVDYSYFGTKDRKKPRNKRDGKRGPSGQLLCSACRSANQGV